MRKPSAFAWLEKADYSITPSNRSISANVRPLCASNRIAFGIMMMMIHGWKETESVCSCCRVDIISWPQCLNWWQQSMTAEDNEHVRGVNKLEVCLNIPFNCSTYFCMFVSISVGNDGGVQMRQVQIAATQCSRVLRWQFVHSRCSEWVVQDKPMWLMNTVGNQHKLKRLL